jgi:vitamin B12 transporter
MKQTLFVLTLITGIASVAVAQETADTFPLREVVVTATRFPQVLGTVPAAVTVIGADEFNRLGLRNVADVLRTVSGAAIVQGGSYGALSSLFLRGGESDYVQVLLDGVQINSPGELFDFSALSLENVDRVEVVKGPASVLYGSDAVAGVIQLFSRTDARRTRAHVTALAGRGNRVGAGATGSFGSLDARAEISGGDRSLSYSAGLTHFDTDGILAYNNHHKLTSGSVRLAAVRGGSDVALSGRLTRNLFHYPTDGAGNLVDANQFHDADAFAFGLDGGHRFSGKTELRAQLSWSRNRDHIDDMPDGAADTLGFYGFLSDEDFRRRSMDVRVNQTLGRAIITVGGELEAQTRNGSSTSESQFGPFESSADNERSNQAAYAQLVGTLGTATLHGGVRLDHNDPFGDFFTYRVGVSYEAARVLRLRGSLGTGFKEPRFFEQFSEGFGARGNPRLEPEQSRSAEVGADLSVRHFTFGATAFDQTFRDLIQYTFMPVTADSVNYTNVGEVSARGLELEARYAHGLASVRASFTMLDTEVTDAGDGNDPLYAQGERLIRRPRQTAALAAQFGAAFSIGAVATYVGEREDLFYDESFTPRRVALPSFVKIDLNGKTPSFSGLRGVVKVENLLDEDYEEVRNFPARGRIIFLGLSLDR